MAVNPHELRPPWRYVPLEFRAPFELLKAKISQVDTQAWPRGEGEPVLVIPGFGQSDQSTALLRQVLARQGFHAQAWGLGRNLGLQSGMTAELLDKISTLYQSSEAKVSLVGWSLGGVIARELARKRPEQIAQVISLGSPLAGPHATTIQGLFQLLNRQQKTSGHDPKRYQAPNVPCTAIFTRSDGVVNWQAALEPSTSGSQNIEVSGSHMGLGFNPKVWFAICHCLARPGEPVVWP